MQPISVGPNAEIKMPNAIEVWAAWMSKTEAAELIEWVNRTPIYHRVPTARQLDFRLRLTDAERERLKLWTIAPYDMTDEERKELRRANDRDRNRRKRQRLLRAAYLANSLSRKKPWEIAGCEIVRVYKDHGISGAKGRDKRPAFDALCRNATLRKFDVVMAWSVDRLGRSLQNLVDFLSELHALDIDLFLHQQGLDTTTPAGKAMFQMFERAMI